MMWVHPQRICLIWPGVFACAPAGWALHMRHLEDISYLAMCCFYTCHLEDSFHSIFCSGIVAWTLY